MQTREQWQHLVRCYVTHWNTPDGAVYVERVVDWLVANPNDPACCVWHACAQVSGARCYCSKCNPQVRVIV